MPLYEYQCDACGERFEVIQKFSDASVDQCRKCGKGPVHRLMSSPAIQFKGSGWYITDYAKKGSGDSSSGSKSEKSEKSDKSDKSDSSDKKSDTSTESKPAASTPAPSAPSKSDT
jgi:putative FmdB family regulatory protein